MPGWFVSGRSIYIYQDSQKVLDMTNLLNILYRTNLLNQFVKHVQLVTGVQKAVQSLFPVKRVLFPISVISHVVQCVSGVLRGFIVLMVV